MRLVRELLLESCLLSLLGASLGVTLARWGLSLLKYPLTGKIPRLAEAGLSMPVLPFALVLVAICTLIFSIVPLLGLKYETVHEALKEAGRTGGGGTPTTAAACCLRVRVCITVTHRLRPPVEELRAPFAH
jgi:hypothetical protein